MTRRTHCSDRNSSVSYMTISLIRQICVALKQRVLALRILCAMWGRSLESSLLVPSRLPIQSSPMYPRVVVYNQVLCSLVVGHPNWLSCTARCSLESSHYRPVSVFSTLIEENYVLSITFGIEVVGAWELPPASSTASYEKDENNRRSCQHDFLDVQLTSSLMFAMASSSTSRGWRMSSSSWSYIAGWRSLRWPNHRHLLFCKLIEHTRHTNSPAATKKRSCINQWRRSRPRGQRSVTRRYADRSWSSLTILVRLIPRSKNLVHTVPNLMKSYKNIVKVAHLVTSYKNLAGSYLISL